jgi:hypothetical protein
LVKPWKGPLLTAASVEAVPLLPLKKAVHTQCSCRWYVRDRCSFECECVRRRPKACTHGCTDLGVEVVREQSRRRPVPHDSSEVSRAATEAVVIGQK